MFELIYFGSGFLAGAVLIWLIMQRQQKHTQKLTEELLRRTQEEKTRELESLIGHVKDAFGSLSMEALSKTTGEFLKLANEKFSEQSKNSQQNLDSKKALIDQTLVRMKEDLNKATEQIEKIEKERKQSFGAIEQQLKNSQEQTLRLQQATNQLNTALSHSQARGQWGERMAEDVLRMAGFIEGINYLKQKSISQGTTRPDFTFLLPHNLKVNMDVKFPLNNYLSYLDAESEQDKNQFKIQFLKDVRQRVKEVTTKDYINSADNTVDYVIVFIPNEQVYAFINENDRTILDEALKNKVILSSPITLYAVLAVIRQAVDNFNLEKTAAQILSLLSEFNKQWDNFKNGMDKMGKKLDDAQREYQSLISTRTTKLERPLQKIENIRSISELALPEQKKTNDGEQETIL
ncbi:MAG: DNA recombination protein RmuC [Calditrichaceae bacterium]